MISFADVPLGLAPPALQDWISRWIPPDAVPEFGYRCWPGFRQSFLTFPKTTRPQPVRIGTLSWPQGASRWAVGHYVVSAEQADEIRKACCEADGNADPTNDPAELLIELKDQNGALVGSKISRQMYALPPRPLSWVKRGKANNLYLLTLVDERYFWQFRPTGDLAGAGTTWTEMIEYLCARLNLAGAEFSIESAVEAVYLAPSSELTTGHSLNAAMLLDAVAYNVGRRVVWTHSIGTGEEVRLLELLTADESYTRFGTNNLTQRKVVSGGLYQFGQRTAPRTLDSERAVILPNKVRLTFPVCDAGSPSCDRFAIDRDCEANGIGTVVFHDRAMAYGTGTPENNTALTDLAERVKADFKTFQQQANMDVVFAGLWDWEPEGISEAVEWTIAFAKNGAGQALTRVFRPAWQAQPEELLHAMQEGAGSGSGTNDDCAEGVRVSDFLQCTESGPLIQDKRLVICNGQLKLQE